MNNTKLLNETLQSLGISKCYKGYRQLHLSVELALDDESRLECITDCIYNQVADMCNCDCRHIERNIRTVANHAWEVNSELLTEIAGYTLLSSPSVSELISILVTHIERNRLENK
ncbi:MAG: sporulation initiation factor Spo0A C-terminal domain-containing protein [Eubacterium sp.]|nr:sporulation initiation factor Spo0A C-terminal domain-containing protein [Eubacterium sp.]